MSTILFFFKTYRVTNGYMSKNLQKMMASKYPTQTAQIMKDSLPQETNKLDPKKILTLVAIFSILFFILATPYTFKTVGSFFPGLNSSSMVDSKLVALHALVFAVIAFFILRSL